MSIEKRTGTSVPLKTILNVYPDSIGGSLAGLIELLKKEDLKECFQSIYILPSLFNSDMDRGFSIIDYNLNGNNASIEDINQLKSMGYFLKLDFVLNHASVQSIQFRDLLFNGQVSPYKDFFINWNSFWEEKGQFAPEGHIVPDHKYLDKMHFRKPGLPILKVRMPDGKIVPYWNTFYQEIITPKVETNTLAAQFCLASEDAQNISDLINSLIDAKKSIEESSWGIYENLKKTILPCLLEKQTYLGQMDLNVNSSLVWDFYHDTIQKLAGYGSKVIRLDAFAYASKIAGASNFFNEPETWTILDRIKSMTEPLGIQLLPEIHAKYEDQIHTRIGEKGYLTYDFFLPGLLIDAIESQSSEHLVLWLHDLQMSQIRTVNMLGCHDGIPLLDLKGILSEERISSLIKLLVDRGGYVKDLHGQKNMYYQVNTTYFSALGEDENKLLLARAIQMFVPGIPQIWYLDLFAGKNDYEALAKAGAGGHKEINRSNLDIDLVLSRLQLDVVSKQLELIRFRNSNPAFGFDARMIILDAPDNQLLIRWEKDGCWATLEANLTNISYLIRTGKDEFESSAITLKNNC